MRSTIRTIAVLSASIAVSGPVSGAPAPTGVPGIPEAARQFIRHGVKDAPARQDGHIRLATYNIHELYDEQDDPALSGRQDDLARTMSEVRRLATAEAISRIDADILALQEVESLEALRWYREAHLSGLGYTHAASVDVGHPIGMEQAVLSRFPILETRTWADRQIGVHPELYRGRPNRDAGQPMFFRRSPLLVELDLDSAGPDAPEHRRLTLLVVHFKTGTGSEPWRAAEGAALGEIAKELLAERPERRLVILGDFAGEPGEGHLSALLESGFHDIFTDARQGDDATATSIGGRRDCLILVGDNARAWVEGTPRFVLGTPAPPAGIDRDLGLRMPGLASEHYPVVVDLAPAKGP
jgi:endonuclease/exonuclease/phosphatase family metal-dependent hydrolase